MTADPWPTPRRRAASYRLRMAATDLSDVADEVRSTGPRPGHAETLAELARTLAGMARDFAFADTINPAEGKEP